MGEGMLTILFYAALIYVAIRMLLWGHQGRVGYSQDNRVCGVAAGVYRRPDDVRPVYARLRCAGTGRDSVDDRCAGGGVKP